MKYRTRADNGLRPPTSITRIDGSDGIFVHWTAGPATQTVAQIQAFHMDTRGWTDIAYSWLVDQQGRIHEGRGWGRAGGHTEGYNSSHHAVCAILGPGDGPPTPAMYDGLSTVIDEHHRLYGPGTVRPHNAVSSTACPGPDLTAFANNYTAHSQEEMTMAQIDELLKAHQDTRRLVLTLAIEEEQREQARLRGEWRFRRQVRDALGLGAATVDDPEPPAGPTARERALTAELAKLPSAS